MEVVWDGTRARGLNPLICELGEPYREPVSPAAPAPAPGGRQKGRGTRGQILEYLGTVAGASVVEICAALDAQDRRDYQRVAAMVGYLKTTGVLAATTKTGISPGGRGYRFHVYSIARKGEDMMAGVETIRINATEALTIADNGEGWQVVTLVNGAAEYLIGLGRSRADALESAQANLQQVLNIVDVAIVQGSAHKDGRVNG